VHFVNYLPNKNLFLKTI